LLLLLLLLWRRRRFSSWNSSLVWPWGSHGGFYDSWKNELVHSTNGDALSLSGYYGLWLMN
jgi:hypothetical protein